MASVQEVMIDARNPKKRILPCTNGCDETPLTCGRDDHGLSHDPMSSQAVCNEKREVIRVEKIVD